MNLLGTIQSILNDASHKGSVVLSKEDAVELARAALPRLQEPQTAAGTTDLANSSGQNWPIKSESAYDLIAELEPFKKIMFDWAEIKTLRALAEEHRRAVATNLQRDPK